jgi:hypothetical protein
MTAIEYVAEYLRHQTLRHVGDSIDAIDEAIEDYGELTGVEVGAIEADYIFQNVHKLVY